MYLIVLQKKKFQFREIAEGLGITDEIVGEVQGY